MGSAWASLLVTVRDINNIFSIQTALVANAGFRNVDHWTRELSIDLFPCPVSARQIHIVRWESRRLS